MRLNRSKLFGAMIRVEVETLARHVDTVTDCKQGLLQLLGIVNVNSFIVATQLLLALLSLFPVLLTNEMVVYLE